MNILITGATKGIGKAIAVKMAKKGHHLALCARTQPDLENLQMELKQINHTIEVFVKKADAGSRQQVLSFADEALAQLGTIDVLVNNAGLFLPSNLLEEDDESLQAQLQVNLMAPYFLYKKLAPEMCRRKSGHIFNICSVAGRETIKNAGSYGVTKAALLSLNHVMRAEMMEHQVKVTAVIPGSTYTHSWEGVQIPIEQFIQAEDVADIIAGVMDLGKSANVEEVVVKPLGGQV